MGGGEDGKRGRCEDVRMGWEEGRRGGLCFPGVGLISSPHILAGDIIKKEKRARQKISTFCFSVHTCVIVYILHCTVVQCT